MSTVTDDTWHRVAVSLHYDYMYVASFLELLQPPSMYMSRFNSVRTGCMVLYYINFICNLQSHGIFYHHYTTYLLLVSEYRILLFSYLILNILASKWSQIKKSTTKSYISSTTTTFLQDSPSKIFQNYQKFESENRILLENNT